jgi:hypothetical protein
VVLVTIKGHSSMDLLPLLITEPERRIAQGLRIDWFGDYYDMTSYESQSRLALQEFTNKHKDKMSSIVILVRSKIVAMGVSVANLATGGKIEAYTSRENFERTLRAAVQRAQQRAQTSAT